MSLGGLIEGNPGKKLALVPLELKRAEKALRLIRDRINELFDLYHRDGRHSKLIATAELALQHYQRNWTTRDDELSR